LRIEEVRIQISSVTLAGRVSIPEQAVGLVIFAHGSGSSRVSPRNVAVADSLHEIGCATMLMDLLTERESLDRANVFDIDLLGRRVVDVTQWIGRRDDPALARLPVAYFGASTGAAAALVAAADLGHQIKSVVSRGGRPDLAGSALPRVTAPTLLLVGSLDVDVLDLNQQAQRQMTCENRLTIVPGATHLFEEPGTLEQVASHAGSWFRTHFQN
jgi:putative phosphoribosyl transferase